MPINKKTNKKNAMRGWKDSAIVPTKQMVHKTRTPPPITLTPPHGKHVTAIATAGKKKKAK